MQSPCCGGRIRYRLDYPNREVRQYLSERMMMVLLPDTAARTARRQRLPRFEGVLPLAVRRCLGKPIHWFGVAFNKAQRPSAAFGVEREA